MPEDNERFLNKPIARWGLAAALVAILVGVFFAFQQDDDHDERERTRARDVQGWALPHADRANSRAASHSKLKESNIKEVKVLWHQDLTPVDAAVAIDSAPLIVDGTVFVQDAGSNVWAFDLDDGDERWRRKFRETAVGANGIAYENGQVIGATTTDAFAVDADSGQVNWRVAVIASPVGPRRESAGIAMAPAVVDGTVFVADSRAKNGGSLVALKAESGDHLWQSALSPRAALLPPFPFGGVLGTPLVIDDDNVVVGVGGTAQRGRVLERAGALVALDADTGLDEWVFSPMTKDPAEINFSLAPAAIVLDDEDAVLVASSDGLIRAVDDDGQQVWEASLGNEFPTQPALADGVVYAATASIIGGVGYLSSHDPVFQLKAIDSERASELWSVNVGAGLGALTVVGDLVLGTSPDGFIHAYARKDGREVWALQLDKDVSNLTSISAWGDYLVVGATRIQNGRSQPSIFVLSLGATEEVEPEQSASVDDTKEQVSDKPATNPVPPTTPSPHPPAVDDDDSSQDHDGDTSDSDSGPDKELPEEPDHPDEIDNQPESKKVYIEVKGGEFAPTQFQVESGKNSFRFVNPTKQKHDLVIYNAKGKKIAASPMIVQDSYDLVVELAEGSYTFVCSEHKDAGMVGTIVAS